MFFTATRKRLLATVFACWMLMFDSTGCAGVCGVIGVCLCVCVCCADVCFEDQKQVGAQALRDSDSSDPCSKHPPFRFSRDCRPENTNKTKNDDWR